MPKRHALTDEQKTNARELRTKGDSIRSIARAVGASPSAIQRLSRVRTKKEFQGIQIVAAPRVQQGPFEWNLERIRSARDEQMHGRFEAPVRLANALRTDDALFVAYHNRVAPLSAIRATLVPHDSVRGKVLAKRASSSVIAPRSVMKGILGTLVNHGLAIGHIKQESNELGTQVNFRLEEWPLEFVWQDYSREVLMTRVKDGTNVPIHHGDGQWIIFRKFDKEPWLQEACLLPAALLWAAHANGISDWAAASLTHGQAKIMGTLPEGVALQDSDKLTPEAQGFLDLLQDFVSGNVGAGIKPFDSEVEFLANGSSAWQVFKELILNRESAAARIYLGTDAFLGASGGAPGVDISALFGISTTIVQGDFEALESGLRSGLYEPWAAVNEGSSHYAPGVRYELTDPDGTAKSEEYAANEDRLMVAIQARRDGGLVVNQPIINQLAARFGVLPAPKLTKADAVSGEGKDE